MMDWVRTSVGYQIYVRSFYDFDGDGVGDIKGIIEKLDILEALGVNLLWVTPFYPSPLDDNGYDVSDFMGVDSRLGSFDDIQTLIDRAHQKKMRVLFDFVMNQTSDEHPWFIEASKEGKNPYQDYYIWQEGDMNRPPNNWASFFGGSAWAYHPQKKMWYLKIFSNKMPDLNWSNPRLRMEMGKVAKFWLDLGVDGFRMDAIAHLAKDMTLSNSTLPLEGGYAPDWSKFSSRPEMFSYLKEFSETVLKDRSTLTIGEVGGGAKWPAADRYLQSGIDMVFNFDACWCLDDQGQTDVCELRKVLDYWISGAQERKVLLPHYWLNHDHPRVMSQYGSTRYFTRSGRMLAMILLSLYGLPFIYNGEEIGMTNVDYQDLEDFKDVSSINYIKNHPDEDPQVVMDHLRKSGRDNGHLPMQWSSKDHAGFSTVFPYLKVNQNYREINVEDQMKDPWSIWSAYRDMIDLRLKSDYRSILTGDSFAWIDQDSPQVLSFKRWDDHHVLRLYANMTDKNATYQKSEGRILMSTDKDHTPSLLRPYEAILLVDEL